MRPVERHRIEEIVLLETIDAETGAPIVTSKMTFAEIADDVEGADVLGPRQGGTATDSKFSALRCCSTTCSRTATGTTPLG